MSPASPTSARGVPPGALPRVVASIVNWNTPQLTLACVRALQAGDPAPWRIVVVDNASHDDSVALLGAVPGITVLRSPGNDGFASGHALAWQQAQRWQADAIWLLNSDAEVEAGALAALLQAWAEHGEALYGGLPLQRRPDGTTIVDLPEKFLAVDGRPRPWSRDRTLLHDTAWHDRAAFAVGVAPGSSLLVPLALVAKHGWLAPRWFMHCEEIDYCYRLRDAGVACYLVPRARCWHSGGGSHRDRAAVADLIQYYRSRNEILLAQEYASRWVAATIALKKLLRGLLTWPRQRRRAGHILRGAIDALRGIDGKTLAPEDGL